MLTAFIVFWIGIAMVVLGSRYRRTVLGTLGVIFGGMITALGVIIATLALGD